MHAVRRTDRLSPPNRGNGNVSVEIIPYIACSNVGIHKASNHVQRVEEEALWVQSSKLHGESLSPIEESILEYRSYRRLFHSFVHCECKTVTQEELTYDLRE